jgi:formamidopyrimidine-DNA glycosylase
MPELPEVETTRRGLAPLLEGRTIRSLDVREPRLRWPVAADIAARVRRSRIHALTRRGKYLLIHAGDGALIVHLGMSGSLKFLPERSPAATHDHFDLTLAGGGLVRFNDPRRFGSLHYTDTPAQHPLLRNLGPEPLEDDFSADYLWQRSRGRRVVIKQHLMNGQVVAGLGNIYVNEALYRAGIHPLRAAGRIAQRRFEPLVIAIRDVLEDALTQGGTTLRDFVGGDGKPGYFQNTLNVYGRGNEACRQCGTAIRRAVTGQRAVYWCPRCQR